MASNTVFESIKEFVGTGQKTGQEIMDHLNMAAPVARSILRDMVVKRLLVHRRGAYSLQGQDMIGNALDKAERAGKMLKGVPADVVAIDEIQDIKE